MSRVEERGTRDATLVVLAKSPVPGAVKTRLCPPCTHEQAASIAAAALRDTLAAAAATPARRRVLALEGPAPDWLGGPFTVVGQRTGGLALRLAGVFDDVGGPALVIGMDTPQVTGALLTAAIDALLTPCVDAVLGPAGDGGYWCVGLRSPDRDAFVGVPMSTPHTGAVQRARLEHLGLRVGELERLDDVDDFAGALAVASLVPGSRFATTVDGVRRELGRSCG